MADPDAKNFLQEFGEVRKTQLQESGVIKMMLLGEESFSISPQSF